MITSVRSPLESGFAFCFRLTTCMANTMLALSYECLKLDQGVKAGNAHFYNDMKLDLFCSFYRLHAKHRIDMMMNFLLST